MAGPDLAMATQLHRSLSRRHPAETLCFAAGFVVAAFLVSPMPWCVVETLVVTAVALGFARVSLCAWVNFLSAPLGFLLLSSLSFLFELRFEAAGWTVTLADGGIERGAALFLRSMAAVSALGFLALTTQPAELLALFRRIGVPKEIVELAALLYRFVSMLMKTLREMRLAQEWRMGEAKGGMRLQAASMLASTLFVRSMQRAVKLEEGLASRGYEGDLPLLPTHAYISPWVICGTVAGQVLFVTASRLVVVWR